MTMTLRRAATALLALLIGDCRRSRRTRSTRRTCCRSTRRSRSMRRRPRAIDRTDLAHRARLLPVSPSHKVESADFTGAACDAAGQAQARRVLRRRRNLSHVAGSEGRRHACRRRALGDAESEVPGLRGCRRVLSAADAERAGRAAFRWPAACSVRPAARSVRCNSASRRASRCRETQAFHIEAIADGGNALLCASRRRRAITSIATRRS